VIKIAEAICLEPIGDDRKQQVPRQMGGGGPLKHAQPACTKPTDIETAQMRDLVINGRFGRGTTFAAFLLHCIRPLVWLGPQRRMVLCRP
jgi:hypothetical protein